VVVHVVGSMRGERIDLSFTRLHPIDASPASIRGTWHLLYALSDLGLATVRIQMSRELSAAPGKSAGRGLIVRGLRSRSALSLHPVLSMERCMYFPQRGGSGKDAHGRHELP